MSNASERLDLVTSHGPHEDGCRVNTACIDLRTVLNERDALIEALNLAHAMFGMSIPNDYRDSVVHRTIAAALEKAGAK